MAELTRKAQIAAGADLAPLTPGEQLVKTLASGGSGGGGGVTPLIVKDVEDTLDKTWIEIAEAFAAGAPVLVQWADGYASVVGVSESSGDYFVTTIIGDDFYKYVAGTEDDYPGYSVPGGGDL